MPEIDFDPKHKRASNEVLEFDRLKLKKDERARIVLLEKPTFAWVHTLRAPKIVDGVAVKIEKKTRKGDTYRDYDMDFVGRPLCLGDYGILADKGVDADNCPACKRSVETDEVNPPERRFAMNVIRYAMTRDGKLITPFSCQAVVWSFTEGIYGRLADIAQEHGKLVGRDLVLGPCTDEGFQKYEIQAGAQSFWQSSDDIKNTVVATFQSNRVAELERACGRKAEFKWMVKDITSIANRWAEARGELRPANTPDVGHGQALTNGLADLVNDAKPVDMDSFLNATPAQVPAPGTETDELAGLLNKERHEEPAAVKSGAEEFNFDSIMDGLR